MFSFGSSSTPAPSKPAIVDTDFNPEPGAVVPTPAEVLAEQQRAKASMWIACIDREAGRLAHEKGVRIGDTILTEAKAVEVFTSALSYLREYYTQSL